LGRNKQKRKDTDKERSSRESRVHLVGSLLIQHPFSLSQYRLRKRKCLKTKDKETKTEAAETSNAF
jgi:hypothetical protein